MIVLRETWVFLSSLDVFCQLFFASVAMTGEDMFCAPLEAIEQDFKERRAAGDAHAAAPGQRLTAGDAPASSSQVPMFNFKSVLPAGQMPRIDAFEWNFAAQHAERGEAQPVGGRPVWDLHQNCLKDAREDCYIPTVLPGSTLYSSTHRRPATFEEHLLFQGLAFATESRPVMSQPNPRRPFLQTNVTFVMVTCIYWYILVYTSIY